MPVLNSTGKAPEGAFSDARTGENVSGFTLELQGAVNAMTVGGEDLTISCDTASQARGLSRRLTFALKALKLPKDTVMISAYHGDVAEDLEKAGKPIVRYIRRVK
jgi:hypothetical protein